MTPLQKIVAKAKSLKKSYPNTKWTDLIKKASKLVTPAKKSVSGIKRVVDTKYAPVKPLINKRIKNRSDFAMAGVKKYPSRSMHKDTRSHNVNIKVVSGVPDNYSFSLGTVELYTQKQFTIFGKVELVIFEPKEKKTIVVLDGKNTKESVKKLLTYIITHNKYKDYDYDIWEEKLNKLIIQLNKEITKYNKDIKSPKTVIKKTASKSYKPKKSIVKKQTVKRSPVKRTRSQESEKVRSFVKKDGFIMPHGYAVSKAKRVSGFVGRVIIKKFTLTELKKLNPNFFSKKIDQHFGIYSRKLIISPKLDTQVLIEASKQRFGNDIFRSYTVRKISPSGEILASNRFNTLLEASNYIGKNIIL